VAEKCTDASLVLSSLLHPSKAEPGLLRTPRAAAQDDIAL
jgi:hypothetical protein